MWPHLFTLPIFRFTTTLGSFNNTSCCHFPQNLTHDTPTTLCCFRQEHLSLPHKIHYLHLTNSHLAFGLWEACSPYSRLEYSPITLSLSLPPAPLTHTVCLGNLPPFTFFILHYRKLYKSKHFIYKYNIPKSL